MKILKNQNFNKSLKAKTILIVEDSIVVIKLLSLSFAKEGFRVLTAEDGFEALEIAIKNDIDLIITDLNMPQMDGITLLKNLKENEDTKNIPVILMSSMEPKEDELKNSYAFLQKPFKESDLLKISKKALNID
ncbi:MAG: response regulator [Candidatus Acididesulfobacter diazotrophicus]|jgi:CheY-like chemotaxis protein|uniref:Response regulator n=1 Tax=Candidatus Acididesulfobacter diazotrophicus TaxID=2597226 RepID=A0A519BMV2_9DELT|nr:MAG: response regulator [Candidatus Acididesulfobacter diazotrophicus]